MSLAGHGREHTDGQVVRGPVIGEQREQVPSKVQARSGRPAVYARVEAITPARSSAGSSSYFYGGLKEKDGCGVAYFRHRHSCKGERLRTILYLFDLVVYTFLLFVSSQYKFGQLE